MFGVRGWRLSVLGGRICDWREFGCVEFHLVAREDSGCNEMMWAEMRCGGALQRDEMFNDRHIASDNRRSMFWQKEEKKTTFSSWTVVFGRREERGWGPRRQGMKSMREKWEVIYESMKIN